MNKLEEWKLDALFPTFIYIVLTLAYISFEGRKSLKNAKIQLEIQNNRLESAMFQLEHQNFKLQKAMKDSEIALEDYRKSNDQIQSIFRASPVGIGVVADRVFHSVNESFCKISGYSRDELIGQSTRLVSLPDEDFEYIGKRLYEIVKTKDMGYLETTLKRKNGEIIHVLLSVTAINPGKLSAGVTFTVMDISDRKRMEADLIESRNRFQSFFEQDITGNVLTTVDGKIIACNPAFAKMFGYESAEEIMAVNVKSFFPAGREIILDRLRNDKILERINFEFIHREKRPLYCVGNLIGHFDQKGILSQITGFYFDETERVLLEKKARERQKLEALGTLSGGIAHDFNNYLQSILGSAQILKGNLTSESELEEDINRIINVSLRAKALTKQILLFGRHSERKVKVVYIQEVLQNLSETYGRIIPPNIEIHFDIKQDCPAVLADPNQLEQVAVNLIVNAYHAVEQTNGHIIVRLKDKIIEKVDPIIDTLKPGRYTVLTVSDTGEGINDDIIDKIFEPYFSTKEIGKGTGLGLSVVYGIVKEHHGSILFSSEVGRGTTFMVYLPVADVELK